MIAQIAQIPQATMPNETQLTNLLNDIFIQAISSQYLERGLYGGDKKRLSKFQAQDLFDAHEKVIAVGYSDYGFLTGFMEVEEATKVCYSGTVSWYACKFLSADNVAYWKLVRAEKHYEGYTTFSMFRGKLND